MVTMVEFYEMKYNIYVNVHGPKICPLSRRSRGFFFLSSRRNTEIYYVSNCCSVLYVHTDILTVPSIIIACDLHTHVYKYIYICWCELSVCSRLGSGHASCVVVPNFCTVPVYN